EDGGPAQTRFPQFLVQRLPSEGPLALGRDGADDHLPGAGKAQPVLFHGPHDGPCAARQVFHLKSIIARIALDRPPRQAGEPMREPYSPVYAQPAAGASGAREDGSPLKIAVQTPLIPGKTTADKAAWAQDHGIDAFEIQAWQIDPVTALKEYRDSPVPVAAVCGNPTFDF